MAGIIFACNFSSLRVHEEGLAYPIVGNHAGNHHFERLFVSWAEQAAFINLVFSSTNVNAVILSICRDLQGEVLFVLEAKLFGAPFGKSFKQLVGSLKPPRFGCDGHLWTM